MPDRKNAIAIIRSFKSGYADSGTYLEKQEHFIFEEPHPPLLQNL